MRQKDHETYELGERLPSATSLGCDEPSLGEDDPWLLEGFVLLPGVAL